MRLEWSGGAGPIRMVQSALCGRRRVGASLLLETECKSLEAIGQGQKLVATAWLKPELLRDPSERFGDAPEIGHPRLSRILVHRLHVLSTNRLQRLWDPRRAQDCCHVLGCVKIGNKHYPIDNCYVDAGYGATTSMPYQSPSSLPGRPREISISGSPLPKSYSVWRVPRALRDSFAAALGKQAVAACTAL